MEYDNDAEVILADLDFAPGEHPAETELKLRILEIYNAKLDEREKRKKFVIERGLLEYKRLLAVERRRPREEREVYDMFRPFARFMTSAEHEEMVRGVILEQRLRKRIAQLHEYRRAGLRTLAEAQEFEAAKRKRENASRRGAALSAAAAAELSTVIKSQFHASAAYLPAGGVFAAAAAQAVGAHDAAATAAATGSAPAAKRKRRAGASPRAVVHVWCPHAAGATSSS